MVSGGSDSLVLSAACHSSVLAREECGTEPKLDNASRDEETSPLTQPPPSATHDSALTEWRHTTSAASFEAPLTPYEHWTTQEEAAAAEPMIAAQLRENSERLMLSRVMSANEREEHELALLRKLTLGKVKWGAMVVDHDLLNSLNIDGIEDRPVRHLVFGSEEDGVEAPQEGELYI